MNRKAYTQIPKQRNKEKKNYLKIGKQSKKAWLHKYTSTKKQVTQNIHIHTYKQIQKKFERTQICTENILRQRYT